MTSSQTTGGTSAQRRFAYDRWGNRTGVWDAVSGGNQIQSIALEQSGGAPTNRMTSVNNGGVVDSYTYDAAGNVTSDGTNNYQYDAENRIVSVNSGSTASYSYDHQNRRVQTVASGVTTHYVWEGSSVIAEHNGSTGAVLTEYIFAGSRMIARESSGGPRLYYLSDRLSVRAMIGDGQGNNWGIQGTQGHMPYGEAMGGSADKHRFTSYEREASTGLDYAVNRWHSPEVGRFMQADPYRASGGARLPQSWNRYSYTRNNPVNSVDMLGLEDEEPIILKSCPPGTKSAGPESGGKCNPIGSSGAGSAVASRGPLIEVEDGPSSETGDVGGGGASDIVDGRTVKIWKRAWRRVKNRYSACKTKVFGSASFYNGKSIPGENDAVLILAASKLNAQFAGMISAIWAKESNFGYRPTGDHGPMQVTKWWWDNHRDLILSGAFDTFWRPENSTNRQRPFEGNPTTNVVTGGNIIIFLFEVHKTASKVAGFYHGGDEERRNSYSQEVMSQWYGKHKEFFDCLLR